MFIFFSFNKTQNIFFFSFVRSTRASCRNAISFELVYFFCMLSTFLLSVLNTCHPRQDRWPFAASYQLTLTEMKVALMLRSWVIIFKQSCITLKSYLLHCSILQKNIETDLSQMIGNVSIYVLSFIFTLIYTKKYVFQNMTFIFGQGGINLLCDEEMFLTELFKQVFQIPLSTLSAKAKSIQVFVLVCRELVISGYSSGLVTFSHTSDQRFPSDYNCQLYYIIIEPEVLKREVLLQFFPFSRN